MSLPNTNRETLLSAALDGELSVQEQLEFDRALASDPSFAQEFEELQMLRLDLKATLNGLREQKPSADFASRIVAAAFEQSMSAPADAHRLPSPAKSSPQPSDDGRWIRIGAACALAASLLIAIGFLNRDRLSNLFAQPISNSLANLNGSPLTTEPEVAPDEVEISPGIPAATDMLAADTTPANTSVNDEPIKVMGIKPLPDTESVLPDQGDVERMAPSPETIASAAASADGSVPDKSVPTLSPSSNNDIAPQANRQPLSLVMVIAVELTEEGRRQMALQEALRAADIRIGQESIVGSQVVSHLRNTNVIRAAEEGEQAQLYFIEAPTKQIDRLVNRLMTSPKSIASVGLSLAMDPPLLAAVGDLREIDPTKVRQEPGVGFARDFRAVNGQSMAFDFSMFAPMDQEMSVSDVLQMQAPSDNTALSGDDSPSQLLLFVK